MQLTSSSPATVDLQLKFEINDLTEQGRNNFMGEELHWGEYTFLSTSNNECKPDKKELVLLDIV